MSQIVVGIIVTVVGTVIADAILQGGNPGDIPFYQPTRYQLLINLNSARDIGLDIPSALLTAADEIIESAP